MAVSSLYATKIISGLKEAPLLYIAGIPFKLKEYI